MKKVRILQAKASSGAKALVEKLREAGVDALRLKVNGSTYKGHPSHFILNWGSSQRRSIREGIALFNQPEATVKASDKVTALSLIEDAVPSTTYHDMATQWVNDGYVVYCRKLTRASEGRGIIVARTIDEMVTAPLYTRGVTVDREIRVHVFDGEVIDYAQKKKMNSERRVEEGIELDTDVRNLKGGWIFARQGVEIPEDAKEVSISAVAALGLDFGAVDVIITEQGQPLVLEVNTAPGLEGTTLERYTNAILSKIQ